MAKENQIESRLLKTERLSQYLPESGDKHGEAVIFIHGNFSSSVYYTALMQAMPGQYYCLAVDLRAYGDTESLTVDATKGAKDWAFDLACLLDALNLNAAHFVGWSAGAAPIMQLAVNDSSRVKSLTLVAPVSPYGFGGTKNQHGDICYQDGAGSGGGVVDSEFIERIEAGDQTKENPSSPLNVIMASYFHGDIKLPLGLSESLMLEGSLKQQIGGRAYPGDHQSSENWPYVSPGDYGPINAISAKHYCLREFVDIELKPPVLWIRGDKDVIIANRSLSDPAVLGEMGLMPDWPGTDKYPPQPMVDQMRHLLEQYQTNGGSYNEIVFADVGHSPFIEKQALFLGHLLGFLEECP